MLNQLKEKIYDADAIMIGAGAGLSTAAGLEYSGKRFEENFSEYIRAYGLTDMYSSAFYPFDTPEERWSYWSKHIYMNRFAFGKSKVYQQLLQLVKTKDYFVLTTNADHQFFINGFDEERIFATQGDYGKLQCGIPCHDRLYDSEAYVMKMRAADKDLKIPTELIPNCPKCGGPLVSHLRIDDTFVENEVWNEANQRYAQFLKKHWQSKILFIELGVGMNTPGIIKYNFWRLTYQMKNGFYTCINKGESYTPKEISHKSMCIDGDIGLCFEKILGGDGNES